MSETNSLLKELDEETQFEKSELNQLSKDDNRHNAQETFKRFGFNTAISECGNKYELDRLISSNNNNTEYKINAIKERFTERLAWYESLLKDWQERLSKANTNNEVIERLEEIRKSIISAFIELGKEKRNLIEKRLDVFSDEIQMLISSQAKTYEDWYRLSQQMFNDGKVGIDILRSRAEQFRDILKKRLETIEEQLNFLDSGGTNFFVTRFLLGNGIAIAAGWFFSVYLLIVNNMSNGVGKEDVWFFLLKCLITALNANPWFALGQILLILTLIGLISFGSYFLLNRMDLERNKEGISFNIANEINESEDDSEISNLKSFHFKLKTDSLFGLFLHAAPVLMGLGVLFVIFKMGLTNPNVDIEKLDISIAGQLIGTMIAYAVGNIIYLFIAKISDLKKLIWINFITLAILFILPILFWYYHDSLQISILGFVFCLFLSAIPLAFGYRYRGLLQMSEQLNQGLGTCAFYIRKYSSPRPVGLHTDQYRQKFKEMQLNLLIWIDEKNNVVKSMQDIHSNDVNQKIVRNLWQEILKIIGFQSKNNPNMPLGQLNNSSLSKEYQDGDDNSLQYLELNSFEKQNFPDYDKLIATYKYEYEVLRHQKHSISKINTKLETDIEKLLVKIFSFRRDQMKSEFYTRFNGMEQENWLREGFELGSWYLKNNLIFPERDCHPIYQANSLTDIVLENPISETSTSVNEIPNVEANDTDPENNNSEKISENNNHLLGIDEASLSNLEEE